MTSSDRERLHSIMALLVTHKGQLDYPLHDVRGRLDTETFGLSWSQAKSRLERGGRLMFDCSGAATCIYRWAALADPNGLGYSHEGYTGTMLAHLPHYDNPRRCRVGALVVFGPGTGEHVAVVYEPDRLHGNPLLFSHGSEQGVGPIRLQDERRFHSPPVTLLNVAAL